jgi:ribonuclease BN (tRNA processing enzyme)
MRVTILGGAAACPNAGQGSSGYLLEIGDHRWLIDCGAGIVPELKKHVRLDQIERVLISHLHADHTLDLVPLRYGLKYDPELTPSLPVLSMPPGSRDFLDALATAFGSGSEPPDHYFETVFEVEEYQPDLGFRHDNIAVTFLRTTHPVPCWAMRIESNGYALVYLADTGPNTFLVPFAKDADLLICEGTFLHYPEASGEQPHLTAFDAGRIASDANAGNFVLTHLWESLGIDEYGQAAREGYGGDVLIAMPGLTLEIG